MPLKWTAHLFLILTITAFSVLTPQSVARAETAIRLERLRLGMFMPEWRAERVLRRLVVDGQFVRSGDPGLRRISIRSPVQNSQNWVEVTLCNLRLIAINAIVFGTVNTAYNMRQAMMRVERYPEITSLQWREFDRGTYHGQGFDLSMPLYPGSTEKVEIKFRYRPGVSGPAQFLWYRSIKNITCQ
jgi:hypothetical protein